MTTATANCIACPHDGAINCGGMDGSISPYIVDKSVSTTGLSFVAAATQPAGVPGPGTYADATVQILEIGTVSIWKRNAYTSTSELLIISF